jgi:hypothetical protein
VGRVGIEPTSYGLRDRCNASICYRPVAPPLGVEPRPSVFRTDAQTAYARVGKMGYLAIPLVLNYAVVKEVNRNIEFRTQESNPDVMVQSHASCHWTSPDQRAAAPRAHVSRSSRGAGSQWGPRELNPAGLLDDAFTARPGFPTGLEPRCRRFRRRKPEEPPGRPGWLLHASATGSTELREWSPPSGTDAIGRIQAV